MHLTTPFGSNLRRRVRVRAALFALSALFAITSAWGASYSTTFDGTENPLSEGGAWSHAGVDWTVVAKDNGLAHGTLTGTGGYNDSYALLSGFAPDQTISAAVHRGTIASGCAPELELLLRFSDSTHSARGYEVLLNSDGGIQFVRWNGAQGDFTVLNGGGNYYGLKEGDVFKASVAGNVIKAYINDVLQFQTTDSVITSGNPGIGFFRRACGSNTDFAFSSVSASDGSTTTGGTTGTGTGTGGTGTGTCPTN